LKRCLKIILSFGTILLAYYIASINIENVYHELMAVPGGQPDMAGALTLLTLRIARIMLAIERVH